MQRQVTRGKRKFGCRAGRRRRGALVELREHGRGEGPALGPRLDATVGSGQGVLAGVGGAVAAAIGERLIRLGRTRQGFAITHSPQVAAAARSQWLVEKGRGKSGGTRLRGLDESDRQEEIARMLSGAEITEEARAAAGRLLEDV